MLGDKKINLKNAETPLSPGLGHVTMFRHVLGHVATFWGASPLLGHVSMSQVALPNKAQVDCWFCFYSATKQQLWHAQKYYVAGLKPKKGIKRWCIHPCTGWLFFCFPLQNSGQEEQYCKEKNNSTKLPWHPSPGKNWKSKTINLEATPALQCCQVVALHPEMICTG